MWCVSFFYEVNSIRKHFRGTRHRARPYIMWWVQFLVIFDNSVKLRGMLYGRVTCGGSCTTKLNIKYECPNVGIRSWPKHESCREHLEDLCVKFGDVMTSFARANPY